MVRERRLQCWKKDRRYGWQMVDGEEMKELQPRARMVRRKWLPGECEREKSRRSECWLRLQLRSFTVELLPPKKRRRSDARVWCG